MSQWLDLSRLSPKGRTDYQSLINRVGKISVWEQISWIHNHLNANIHGNDVFLIWHRQFVAEVEKVLQKYDPNFCMFYWATHLMYHPSVWTKDPIWTHFGTAVADRDGDEFTGRDITDGPLAGIQFGATISVAGRKRGLYRDYDLKDSYVATATDGRGSPVYMWAPLEYYNSAYEASLQPSATGNDGFAVYAYQAQLIHGYVHNSQGGFMGSMFSPIDPLFWAHHSNVDYLWHIVQQKWNDDNRPQSFQIKGSCPSNPTQRPPWCLTLNTNLDYWNVPVSKAQFSSQFCAQYQPPINGPFTGQPPSNPTTTTTTTTTSPPTGTGVPEGSRCGAANGNAKCAAGVCCSQFGWCGREAAHCVNNCQANFGNCGAQFVSTKPPTPSPTQPTVPEGSRCGAAHGNAKCAAGVCCSTIGWCGREVAHCVNQCQRNFGDCGAQFVSTKPSTPTVPEGSRCGAANGGAKCAAGVCCSQFGWCGREAAHCVNRCQANFGSCGARFVRSGLAGRSVRLDVVTLNRVDGWLEKRATAPTPGAPTASYGGAAPAPAAPTASYAEGEIVPTPIETTALPTLAESLTDSPVETTALDETPTLGLPSPSLPAITQLPIPTPDAVPYQAPKAALPVLPESWCHMNFPNANPAKIVADLKHFINTTDHKIKHEIPILAPVPYMQNNYTGHLAPVPPKVFKQLIPTQIVAKQKCHHKGGYGGETGVAPTEAPAPVETTPLATGGEAPAPSAPTPSETYGYVN
ncbi:hypothetical protein HK104_003254 [Borealophlyctis nickersoniae]|nr:hypothetical protein HK104_003254 [Borealophlyctis nickersoniae]